MRVRYDERMDMADARHRACEDANEELRGEIRRLNRVIQGMLDQFRQVGITSIHLFETKGQPASPNIEDAMNRLSDKGPQIPPR